MQVTTPDGRRGLAPASKAEALRAKGYHVVEVPSTAMAGLLGLGQGVTQGFGDELYGAASGLAHPSEFSKHYQGARDEAREKLALAEKTSPLAYGGGRLAGNVATGALVPGGPIAAGALSGALNAAGESEESNPAALATDAATGAAVGGALGGAGKLAGEAAGKLAPRLFNRVHQVTPAEVGTRTYPEAAAKTAAVMEKHPELWRTGGSANLAEKGHELMPELGAKMERAQLAQPGHPTTARDFHNEIESQFHRDLPGNPHLRGVLDEVHRAARPDRFNQLFASAKQHGMGDAQARKMASLALRHDRTPMTLREMQEAGNSLKGQLDLYHSNPNARFAGNSPLTPAHVAERAHANVGEQVNSASGPEALATRQDYGATNRLLGPTMKRVATTPEQGASAGLNPMKPVQSAKNILGQAAGAMRVPGALHAASKVVPKATPGLGGAAAGAATEPGDKPLTRLQLAAAEAKRRALAGSSGVQGAAKSLVSKETSPEYNALQRRAAEHAHREGKASETVAGPQR